jgi:hypothetical protein
VVNITKTLIGLDCTYSEDGGGGRAHTRNSRRGTSSGDAAGGPGPRDAGAGPGDVPELMSGGFAGRGLAPTAPRRSQQLTRDGGPGARGSSPQRRWRADHGTHWEEEDKIEKIKEKERGNKRA